MHYTIISRLKIRREATVFRVLCLFIIAVGILGCSLRNQEEPTGVSESEPVSQTSDVPTIPVPVPSVTSTKDGATKAPQATTSLPVRTDASVTATSVPTQLGAALNEFLPKFDDSSSEPTFTCDVLLDSFEDVGLPKGMYFVDESELKFEGVVAKSKDGAPYLTYESHLIDVLTGEKTEVSSNSTSDYFTCTEACTVSLHKTQPTEERWELVTVLGLIPEDTGMWLVSESDRISVSAMVPGPYGIGIGYPSGGVSTYYSSPQFHTESWTDDGSLLVLIGSLFPYGDFASDIVTFYWDDGQPTYHYIDSFSSIRVAFSPKDKLLLVELPQGTIGESDGRLTSPKNNYLQLYSVADGGLHLLDEEAYGSDGDIISIGWDEAQRSLYYVTEKKEGVTLVEGASNLSAYIPSDFLADRIGITDIGATFTGDNIEFALSNTGYVAFRVNNRVNTLACTPNR